MRSAKWLGGFLWKRGDGAVIDGSINGIAMGIVNAAANAPVEAGTAGAAAAAAAAAAARARTRAFRPRATDIARTPALPPWTTFYADACALADALCYGDGGGGSGGDGARAHH